MDSHLPATSPLKLTVGQACHQGEASPGTEALASTAKFKGHTRNSRHSVLKVQGGLGAPGAGRTAGQRHLGAGTPGRLRGAGRGALGPPAPRVPAGVAPLQRPRGRKRRTCARGRLPRALGAGAARVDASTSAAGRPRAEGECPDLPAPGPPFPVPRLSGSFPDSGGGESVPPPKKNTTRQSTSAFPLVPSPRGSPPGHVNTERCSWAFYFGGLGDKCLVF